MRVFERGVGIDGGQSRSLRSPPLTRLRDLKKAAPFPGFSSKGGVGKPPWGFRGAKREPGWGKFPPCPQRRQGNPGKDVRGGRHSPSPKMSKEAKMRDKSEGKRGAEGPGIVMRGRRRRSAAGTRWAEWS